MILLGFGLHRLKVDHTVREGRVVERLTWDKRQWGRSGSSSSEPIVTRIPGRSN